MRYSWPPNLKRSLKNDTENTWIIFMSGHGTLSYGLLSHVCLIVGFFRADGEGSQSLGSQSDLASAWEVASAWPVLERTIWVIFTGRPRVLPGLLLVTSANTSYQHCQFCLQIIWTMKWNLFSLSGYSLANWTWQNKIATIWIVLLKPTGVMLCQDIRYGYS